MSRVAFYAWLLVALLCMAPKTLAGPMVTLSSPDNLTNLDRG